MSFCSSSSSHDSESENEQEFVVQSHSRILISPRRSRRRRSTQRSRKSLKHRISSSRRHLGDEASGEFSGGKGRTDVGLGSESPWEPFRPTQTDQQSSTSHPKTPSVSGSESDGSDGERKTSQPPRARKRPKGSTRPNLKEKNEQLSAFEKAPRGSLEDLKRTLNKLAHQTDRVHSIPAPDYIRAMPVLESLGVPPPVEQLRLAEYLNGSTRASGSKKSIRHASLQSVSSSPRWSDTHPRKSKSIAFGDQQYLSHPPLHQTTSSSPNKLYPETSVNKKLFSGQIPAAYIQSKGTTSYAAGTDTSPASGAQGSRALLSALKALQDKIRRLEEERESLMQELSDAKVKIRKQEAELTANEKKSSYELRQTKEAARGAYEAIRAEREELKVDLAKAEERRKSMTSEIEHFRALAQTFSTKADDLTTQLQISEKQRSRLEMETEKIKRDSEKLIEGLKLELERTHDQLQETQIRLESTSTELENETAGHKKVRERLRESEQTVSALSQLNEKLVGKVWEATEAANTANKKTKKLQAQQRVSTLTRPTAASTANITSISATTTSTRRNTEAKRISGGTSTGGHRSVTRSESTSGPSKAKKKVTKSVKATVKVSKSLEPAHGDNMTLLREANMGKEIPFLAGGPTGRSFSVIGNAQDAIRQCDTTYLRPSLIGSSNTTPTTVHSRRSRPQENEASKRVCTSAPVQEEREYLRGSGEGATPRSTRSRSGSSSFKKNKPEAIKVPPANPYMSPMQAQIMEDLREAVESAEREFQELNDRYKEIVSEIETSRNEPTADSDGDESQCRGSSAQLSEALGPLLDDLEAKGKQLNLLKQVYEQAARSTINPMRRVVVSPEAVRRKTASLRVLNEYRQLEREARGATPSSPRLQSRWS